MLLCALALLLKLVVPTGHMIAFDHGRIAITVCPGTVPAPVATTTMAGMHGGMEHHRPPRDHARPEMPCAFAGLSAAALAAIDPILLVALIAFVAARGRAPVPLPAPFAAAHLRPPLRGPPGRR